MHPGQLSMDLLLLGFELQSFDCGLHALIMFTDLQDRITSPPNAVNSLIKGICTKKSAT